MNRNLKLVLATLALVASYFFPELLVGAPFLMVGETEEPDEGEGGGNDDPEWPEYDAPEGVEGGGDEDPEEDGEGGDPKPPKRSAGASREDDPADGDEDPEPEGEGQGNQRMVPAYRLRQQQERFERQLESSNRRVELLENMVRNVLGGQGDGNGGRGSGAPTFTPEQQRLRAEFLKLFPEFTDLTQLAPKAKDLLGLTERVPEWERDTDQYWNRVARTTTTRLYAAAAKELGVKKLGDDDQHIVRDAFVSWVKADRTGERNHRYEGQDESLVSDFLTAYLSRFRQPAQRQGNANALRRQAQQRALPRGGGSSSRVPPTPTGPKRKGGGEDEDPFEAVNSRAWSKLRAELDGQS